MPRSARASDWMNDKIAWYKEVLELEPGSKVFLPLARLLADAGEPAQAAAALRQGLTSHPDHAEARLLLVQVLAESGDHAGARTESKRLSQLLSNAPAFLAAWADGLARSAASGNGLPENLSQDSAADAAVALGFLAHLFSGREVSWAKVLLAGLSALSAQATGEPAPARSQPAPEPAKRSTDPEDEDSSAQVLDAASRAAAAVADFMGTSGEKAQPDAELPDFTQPKANAPEGPRPESKGGLAPDALPLTPEDRVVQAVQDAVQDLSADDLDEVNLDTDAAISLRTRTMAAVLAEQGDVAGALDIYRELMNALPDGPKRQELAEAIQALETRGTARPTDEDGEAKGPQKLMHTLENLARRLENRAAQEL